VLKNLYVPFVMLLLFVGCGSRQFVVDFKDAPNPFCASAQVSMDKNEHIVLLESISANESGEFSTQTGPYGSANFKEALSGNLESYVIAKTHGQKNVAVRNTALVFESYKLFMPYHGETKISLSLTGELVEIKQ
jgi:hypothetical protein